MHCRANQSSPWWISLDQTLMHYFSLNDRVRYSRELQQFVFFVAAERYAWLTFTWGQLQKAVYGWWVFARWIHRRAPYRVLKPWGGHPWSAATLRTDRTASLQNRDTVFAGGSHNTRSSVSPDSDDPKSVSWLSVRSLSWHTTWTDSTIYNG